MSKLFNYVKNQVLLSNFSVDDLFVLVDRKVITDAERLKLQLIIK
ncbi:hypothetical protein [Lysinibacillus xylanilyticus]|nr:hypothetical protein [Lysinibacillus xylanilyticus]